MINDGYQVKAQWRNIIVQCTGSQKLEALRKHIGAFSWGLATTTVVHEFMTHIHEVARNFLLLGAAIEAIVITVLTILIG